MASGMPFRELADHFRKIEDASKRLELTALVVELLRATPHAIVDKVLYLLQGRIYPDFVGVELGVAEKLTARALVKTLGATESEVQTLQNKLGDLGLAAEELLAKRRQRALSSEPLTVSGVYNVFEKIAASTGPGSQDAKLGLLGELLHAASPLEGRYLVRLVTGKLRLGVADQTLLEGLALFASKRKATSVTDLGEEERKEREDAKRAVERAMEVTSDIALVAKTLLESGLPALQRLKIKLGVPVRPMLAERVESLEEALEKMGGRAQVEYKYDGLRVQAHVGDTIELFSRRLERITPQFPDLVEALEDARKGRKDFIIEGEAVAVDPKTGRIRPFQELATRRGRKYGLGGGDDGAATRGKVTPVDFTKEVPVRFYVFDVLYHDGHDLTSKPLEERRHVVQGLVKENDRIALAEMSVYGTVKALEDYFDRVSTMGAEGIMIKKLDSPYEAGSRGWNWIKFKADYQEDLADSFDLVAIGAYWGQGRRGGWYGALLLACLNEDTGAYESVCRLATGFSDADLAGLEKKCAPHVARTKPKRIESEEEPDLWLEPDLVLEVVGAELTLSPRHRCGWGALKDDAGLSVRFPRFKTWRTDKKAGQATTTSEIVKMYKAKAKARAEAQR